MHYNYYFEVSSLVLMSFIACAYYSRKKFPIPAFKLFGIFLAVVLVNISLNITVYSLLEAKNIPLGIHELFSELFYFSQIFLSYLFFVYVLYCVGKSFKYSPIYLLTLIPSIALSLALFTNPIHHFFFNLVEYEPGLYDIVRAPGYYLFYAVAGLNVLSALIYTIYFRKELPKKVITILFVTVIAVMISLIVQHFVKRVILTGIAYTLSMMLALITINDPDEKVDRISKAFNNDAFIDYINNQRWERQRKHYVMFAIDGLGIFNKMFGLAYANQMLALVVKKIESINKKAYIFKTKSARFVILLRNREEQIKMVEKIKEVFSAPLLIDNKEVSITVRSFYFVNKNVFRNSDSYNEFITRILPLINLKENNFSELDEKFLTRINRDRRIKEIIENCLKTKTGLYMVYQPIYDVKKDCFNHFEALIRLANNEMGYIGPAEFIPIAENAGLANDIDNFVFEETCAFLARNPGIEILEINVSCAEFFMNPSARYINTIEKYKIDPRRICLEITETVAVKYPEKTQEFMTDLGQYGVKFAMDDFGSGYSNIARFITLPFSLAKLDKTLLNASDRIQIFFDSAIELFKNLNIPIVIEGVETEEQLDLVKKKQIDYVQGYYFSKPLEEDNLIDFLKRNN